MPINTSDARSNQDPVFLHARREAIIIFLVWVVALLWAVPYYYATGYNIDANQLQLIYGIPGWVFGGMWAFAMTVAATSVSGGSFTGFPAKIYTHGWIMALWIGSYMVVPICMIGILGKRLNQVDRISGKITVPDVFRDRFASPAVGILATALIVFFMSFNLVAQFKAGSLILRTMLDSVSVFHQGAAAVGAFFDGWGLLHGVDPEYLLGLMVFGIVVVVYTAYGGFHAVVWTDVMQGFIMVAGVVILLPLALYQVGGLELATRQMAKMMPPIKGVGTVAVAGSSTQELAIQAGSGFVPRWDRRMLRRRGCSRWLARPRSLRACRRHRSSCWR